LVLLEGRALEIRKKKEEAPMGSGGSEVED
jgi:hypothetical protein